MTEGWNLEECLCQKQIRFLKHPSSLASYYSPRQEAIQLTEYDSDHHSPQLIHLKLPPSQVFKGLSRLPSNNVMIVALVLLQLSFEDKNNQELLNKIKKYAYDQSSQMIDMLETSERGKNSQQVIRKLFVEFFHLISVSTEKNKVEKFMYKYPIMQCSFVLLLRKILMVNGVADAGNLQLPIPTIWIVETLCRVLDVSWKMVSNGSFEIRGRRVIEDASHIYKICEKEFEMGGASREEDMIDRLLEDSVCEEGQKMVEQSYVSAESRFSYSRPESSISKHFQSRSQDKRGPTILFPRKQVDGYSTVKVVEGSIPLSFGRTPTRSQTPILSNSHIAYPFKSMQSSQNFISYPSEKQLVHQRSSSTTNFLNTQNPTKYYPPLPPTLQTFERQKSYQGLPQIRIPSFSPLKQSKHFQYPTDPIPRTTTPLAYFSQPLLSKNSNFMDRRWNLSKVENQQTFRFDAKSYQFGY